MKALELLEIPGCARFRNAPEQRRACSFLIFSTCKDWAATWIARISRSTPAQPQTRTAAFDCRVLQSTNILPCKYSPACRVKPKMYGGVLQRKTDGLPRTGPPWAWHWHLAGCVIAWCWCRMGSFGTSGRVSSKSHILVYTV